MNDSEECGLQGQFLEPAFLVANMVAQGFVEIRKQESHGNAVDDSQGQRSFKRRSRSAAFVVRQDSRSP